MSVDRADEKFAFETVRRVLDVQVEEYDIDGRQRAVDALLHYRDGRVAALEVSSIGPADEARITNMLNRPGRSRRIVEGLTRSWLASVPRDFHPADLRKVDQVLLRCDNRGITDLKHATDDEEATEWVGRGVRAIATSDATQEPPVVWVVLEAIWGFTDAGTSTLNAELDTMLASNNMQAKIDKLAATGIRELHLFLLVRPSGLSFPVYDTLALGGPLPNEPPSLPNGLSQIWLVSGWKHGGVVRAIADQGWFRTDPFD